MCLLTFRKSVYNYGKTEKTAALWLALRGGGGGGESQ